MILGVLAILAGGVSAFRSAGDAGTPILLITGTVLLISPFLIPHLEKISISSSGFELTIARQVAEQGAPATAQLLDHTELARLAEAYGIIRAEFPDEDNKTLRIQVQEALLRRAAAFATQHKFDPHEVAALFGRAAPVTRVLLLGLMEGDPALADPTALASAIGCPATANEQYHALSLAEKQWLRFSKVERAMIRGVAESADFGLGQTGRRTIADRIAKLVV